MTSTTRAYARRTLSVVSLLVVALLGLLIDVGASACVAPTFCSDPSPDRSLATSRERFDAEEWGRVSSGVPVLRQASRPGFSPRGDDHVRGLLRVEASIEEVWAVLSGLEDWSSVFPDVDYAHLERRPDGTLVLHQIVHGMGQSMRYSAIARIEPESWQVSIMMSRDRPSDFEDMVLRWHLEPLPDGSTLIELRLRGESGYSVPAFVERRILEHGVRRSLLAVADAAAPGDAFPASHATSRGGR
jgi:hypothetical protein